MAKDFKSMIVEEVVKNVGSHLISAGVKKINIVETGKKVVGGITGKGYEKVSVEEAKEIIKRHTLGKKNNIFSNWKEKITEKITGVPMSLTDEDISSEKLELGKKKKIEYIVCNDSVIFMLPGVRDGDFELRLNKEKGLILVDFSEKNSFPNCLGYIGVYVFNVSTDITNRIQGGRVSLDSHGLLSIGLERVEI